MSLTPSDLAEIEAIISKHFALHRQSKESPVPDLPPLPAKLTVHEFAFCVQRSAYHVRERRRLNRDFRKLCQGRNPILIHPGALKIFGVDSGLAAARLAQFQAEKRPLING